MGMTPEEERAAFEAIAGDFRADTTDPADVAAENFRDALVPTVQAVISLAQHGSNEKIRFEAQRYVIDRCLGSIVHAQPVAAQMSPLDKFLVNTTVKKEGR